MAESPLEHHKMALALCCIAHVSCTALHKKVHGTTGRESRKCSLGLKFILLNFDWSFPS